MSLDENTQLFVTESNELLEDMEQALLALERAPNDADLINRIFRTAHTIKGSAGLFGFDHIISFTHVAENLLDDVRNCLLPVNDDLVSLLMRAKDHIALLINHLPEELAAESGDGRELVALLAACKAGGGAPAPAASSAGPENDASENDAGAEAGSESEAPASGTFHISLRLGIDTFRQGFDPLPLFGQLRELGVIEEARLLTEAIPPLSELDAEDCHLGWDIALKSSANKEEIAEVFEFIGDASVSIVPPQSGDTRSEQPVVRQDAGGTEVPSQEETRDTGQPRDVRQSRNNFVRVDADKLDKLVNLVGELVISGAKVSQLAGMFNDDDLGESIEEMTVALEDMRETVLSLRMVPIGNTFKRFHRVVRDTARDLEKKIRLKISGAETELDKTVIERIGDPLTHLIRNAMDHGIEPPLERSNAGKPEEGIIQLDAYHETGSIVIEIHDDGRGLDVERIRSIAEQRGLVSPQQVLSKREVLLLIFEPGFSTAETVNNLSGRGVGMDVVRRNIESLRGTVDVSSETGKGTRIIIRLPLTLAIIDGFHIVVGSDSFIIPLDTMVECVTLTQAQCEEVKVHNYINLRDEILPLINLRSHFHIKDATVDKGRRQNVVVVQFAGKKVGLLVDALHGEAQAVIKPLGGVFQGISSFAGFTILGSGQVALIMDVPDMIKVAVQIDRKRHPSEKLMEGRDYVH